jgi:hypothetical protein
MVLALTTSILLQGSLSANFAKILIMQVLLYQGITKNKKFANILFNRFGRGELDENDVVGGQASKFLSVVQMFLHSQSGVESDKSSG